jgi:hypothetical protein
MMPFDGCRQGGMFLLWIATAVVLACPSRAGDVGIDRESVRRGSNPIWVDRETDRIVHPPSQLARSDVADRHDSIRSNLPSKTWWESLFGPNTGKGSFSSSLSDFFTWMLDIWRVLLLILLVVLAALALVFLARMNGWNAMFRRRTNTILQEDLEQQRAKISDLPFEIEQPLVGLKEQADRYRRSGDYSKAIVYLFSYLLVELDHSHCIRLERGKTNGVYLREIRTRPEVYGYLTQVTQLFEQSFFGRRIIEPSPFDGLWNALPEVEAYLTKLRDRRVREVEVSGAALSGVAT